MFPLAIRDHLIRIAARVLSPPGPRARLTILIYHRVRPAPDPLQPDVLDIQAFERQMALVRACLRVLPLGEAVARLRAGTLPARSACITFDDGYADNLTCALPILTRKGLPATFFIATDFLDGGLMFNDAVIEAVRHAPAGQYDLSELGLSPYTLESPMERQRAIQTILASVKYLTPPQRNERVAEIVARLTTTDLPKDLMLSTAQLRALHAAGMTIGAHTASHPILARLDETAAREDIERGKAQLEHILSDDVRLFAYPNGKPGIDYHLTHVAMTRMLGFQAAVSTANGTATRQTDAYQLPRFSPWSQNPTKSSLQLLRNLAQRQSVPALL